MRSSAAPKRTRSNGDAAASASSSSSSSSPFSFLSALNSPLASSQSSSSPSPPPRATIGRFGSSNAASAAQKKVPLLRASSAQLQQQHQSSSSQSHSQHSIAEDDEEEFDPFGDAVPTQPMDEDDEEPASRHKKSAPPSSTTTKRSNSSSAAVPASVPTLARVTSVQLSGASREKADELQFLIDGLTSTHILATRANSSLKFMQMLLKEESLTMAVMRASEGFKRVADAIPPPSDIKKQENELFATLFTCIAFLSCHQLTNASSFTSRCVDLLIALAFDDVDEDQIAAAGHAKDDGESEMKDDEPSVAASSSLRKNRRTTSSSNTTRPADLISLLLEREKTKDAMNDTNTKETKDGSNKAKQIHLDALTDLKYLSLITLTSFSSDTTFATHMLNSKLYSKDRVFKSILTVMGEAHQQVKKAMQPQRRGRKSSSAATSSPVTSNEYFLAQHRLLCCLTLIEHLTNQQPNDFALLCRHCKSKMADDDDKEDDEEKEEEQKENEKVADSDRIDGVQLLFDITATLTSNIEKHQTTNTTDSSTDEATLIGSPMSVSYLPSIESYPLTPILSILRILVNVTNRNDVGVNAMNEMYRTSDVASSPASASSSSPSISSGLALLFDLISSIRWSFLSQLIGQPDMFNLLSVGLPIIVNSLEWSKKSLTIVEESCRVNLLPENAKLAADAIVALPALPSSPLAASPPPSSSPDVKVTALDFVGALWNHLHHQLEILAAKAQAEAKTQQAIPSPTVCDLTLEQQYADPFATVASKVGAQDATMDDDTGAEAAAAANSSGATVFESHLAAKVSSANEIEEEVSLGYRTLASMCSLLLGFFACTSPQQAKRILRLIHMTSFQPLLQYIQEFLLLQSDSQVLQQEGLDTTFAMVEQLKKLDRTLNHSESDTSVTAGSGGEEGVIEPPNKKQRIYGNATSTPSTKVTNATSSPFSPPPPSSSSSMSTFDRLFQQQQKK